MYYVWYLKISIGIYKLLNFDACHSSDFAFTIFCYNKLYLIDLLKNLFFAVFICDTIDHRNLRHVSGIFMRALR